MSYTRIVPLQNFVITSGLATRAKTAPFAPFGGANFSVDTDNASIESGCLVFRKAPSATQSQGVQLDLTPYLREGEHLAAVRVSLQGAAAHAGMTMTNASVGIFRKSLTTATLQSLRSAGDFTPDPSASTAVYQAQHDLAVGCDQNLVISRSDYGDGGIGYTYYVQLWNEFGTHALPGLKLYGLELTLYDISDVIAGRYTPP